MKTLHRVSLWATGAVTLFSVAGLAFAGGPGDPHGTPVLAGGPGDPHGGPTVTGGPSDPHGSPILNGGPGDPHGGPTLSGGPGDPHGTPKATTGLGQAAPPSFNVSQNAAWAAYEFERDGIQYLQVNDRRGNVHAIIGNVGETFWTLPAGSAADRVSLPQQTLSIPAGATRIEVYRKSGAVLAAYEVDGGIIWSIEAPDGTR